MCCSYNTDVPLVLMNSFLTDEDTEKIIRKYSSFQVSIKTFRQSCYPRISRDTLMPAPRWPPSTAVNGPSRSFTVSGKGPQEGHASSGFAGPILGPWLPTRRMP